MICVCVRAFHSQSILLNLNNVGGQGYQGRSAAKSAGGDRKKCFLSDN